MIRSVSRRNLAWKLLLVFLAGELSHLPLRAGGGPSAPEVQTFTPAGIDDLVDPFSGDFSYNIPLLDVGGYPINLSYHSGAGAEEEASWVGLGWSLNPGAINRSVRGLPDDFKGDPISKEINLATDNTFGSRMTISGELYGYELLQNLPITVGNSLTIGFQHNNYMGWDYTVGSSNSIGASLTQGDGKLSGSLSLSSGYSRSEGNYIRPNAGLSFQHQQGEQSDGLAMNLGMSATSRKGLESLNFGLGFSKNWNTSMREPAMSVGGVSAGPGSVSVRSSFPLHYAHPSYVPTFDLPRVSLSGTFSGKIGAELVGFALAGEVSGYFGFQKLKKNTLKMPAFGYVYAQEATDAAALQDINREKDGPYQEKSPHLPLPVFTHDIYQASGMGFQGQFRPFRGDVGTLSDPAVNSDANAASFGAEASFGNLVKAGVDLTITNTQSNSGKWQSGNQAANIFRFQKNDPDNPLYEPVYFKRVGELTALSNPKVFDDLGAFQPVYVPVDKLRAAATLRRGDESGETTFNAAAEVMRRKREARLETMSFLRADEAQQAGLERSLYSSGGLVLYDDINLTYDVHRRPMPRIDNRREPHHISEMSVNREDGTRYVYGLPVYNTEKTEVSFNASGLSPDPGSGMVTYTPGTDNSSANRRGLNHYFSKTQTPPYAYAYLLTAVLSPDYVDLTGNGPSPDDLGTYTRFSYQQVHDEFGWRMPFGVNQAKFEAGHQATDEDDVASYVYGKKELWYLKNVETKNFIAEFHFSDRTDVRSISDENGAVGSTRLQKLDRIVLYNRADVVDHGPDEAIPVKTVYFHYDYSLCSGTPGASAGKLTLRSVSYSFDRSNRSRYNAYTFEYANNEPYAPKGYDRWGNYKSPTASLDNDHFPYTPLEKSTADTYAAAWHLSAIHTPANSDIRIQYEADDYGYVQDRPAMNMRSILGFSDHVVSTATELSDRLYDGRGGAADLPYDYLYFRMEEAATGPEDVAHYLQGIRELYFNCRVEVLSGRWEDIQGFIPLDDPEYGFLAAEPQVGWLRVPKFNADARDTPHSSGNMHPITKASAQELAKEQPKIAYDLGGFDGDDFLKFMEVISANLALGAIAGVIDFENYVDEYRKAGRGQRINLDYSMVRLNNPNKRKFGGGSRVKRIEISDNWAGMSGGDHESFSYGQEFFYTMEEDGREISSGVAAYEPLIGGEENPFVEPARYFEEIKLAADVNDFAMLPLGESLFPAANVGYRQVRVRNLPHEGVERTATGQTLYEFYTAKEFPTISRATRLDSYLEKPSFNPFQHKSSATASQGFYIELNDMHGKAKGTSIFAEHDLDNPISGVSYFYQTDPADNKRLNNRVKTINPETGEIQDALVGVEYELVMDARASSIQAFSGGAEVNVDVSLLGPVPSVSVSGYPSIEITNVDYRGLVTTKVVQRVGILAATKVFDNGSVMKTQNELYDGLTGDVLISSVQNEFDDLVFDTKIPAYWQYPGMGHAYENLQLELLAQSATSGRINIAEAPRLFRIGDELMIRPVDETESVPVDGVPLLERDAPAKRAWVMQVNPGSIDIIDVAGAPISGTFDLKVLRSGKRNMPALPVLSVQSLANPVESGQFVFSKVTDAEAYAYDDYWQTYLGFITEIPTSYCTCTENRDVYGNTIREAILEFLQNELIHRDLSNPTAEPTPLPARYAFLPDGFHRGNTEYYLTTEASELSIAFRDTITNETCNLSLSMREGAPFPDNFFLPAGEKGHLLSLPSYACENQGKFEFNLNFYDTQQTVTSRRVVAFSDCIDILYCSESIEEFPPVSCGIESGAKVNPFMLGILGNWRPKTTSKFFTDRNYSTGHIRQDGIFADFFVHAQPVNGIELLPAEAAIASGRWQELATSTVIDPFGKELENDDPLNMPAAVLYGYGFNFPIAMVQNASYQEVAYDGFEDYEFENQAESPFAECSLPSHLRFDRSAVPVNDAAAIGRDTGQFHSGRYSLRVRNSSVDLLRDVFERCDPTDRNPASGPAYAIEDCDLIRTFSPRSGKYLISAWVKERPAAGISVLDTAYEHSSLTVDIQMGTSTISETFQPSGPRIDGWQQVEGEFIIPDGQVESFRLTFRSDDAAWISYFDDVRIQPFSAVMNTYVYDPITFRLTASHDERNYTTFYEYDQEGNLARSEQETEAGKLSVQETRSSLPYNFRIPSR